jgi:hypothetical protein
MIFSDPKLFERAAHELLRHASHKIGIMLFGGDAAPESVIVECEQCHEVLIDFLPEAHNERLDPDRVKYEAINSRRLICATSRSRNPASRPIQCRSGRT